MSFSAKAAVLAMRFVKRLGLFPKMRDIEDETAKATHTHVVSHSHEHNHMLSDERHGHHHSKEELLMALKEAHQT